MATKLIAVNNNTSLNDSTTTFASLVFVIYFNTSAIPGVKQVLDIPVTLSQISDIDSNPGGTTYNTILTQIKTQFENRVLLIDSEQCYISNVSGLQFNPPAQAVSNPDGGYFINAINMQVIRGYNGTTAVGHSEIGGQSFPYLKTISVDYTSGTNYNDTVGDTIEIGNTINGKAQFTNNLNSIIAFNLNATAKMAYKNALNSQITFGSSAFGGGNIYTRTVSSQLSFTQTRSSKLNLKNNINSTITINNTVINKTAFINIINQTFGLKIEQTSIARFRAFINEVIEFTLTAQRMSASEFLQVVNDLFVLKSANKGVVGFKNIINDVIRLYATANVLNPNQIFAVCNDFINFNSSSSNLINTAKIYNVVVNELFRIFNINTTSTAKFVNNIADYMRFYPSFTQKGNSLAIISDKFKFIDTFISNLSFKEIVEELIRCSFVVNLGDEQYECYAINLENKALTNYDDYKFNSYCQFKQKYYGMQKEGLAELVVLDGTGRTVESTVKTGFFNIANIEEKVNSLSDLRLREKYLKTAYFIVRNNGEVTLRVYTDHNKQFDYMIKQSYDDEKCRVDYGRNVRGGLFQLEINAIDEFELKECTFIPVILNRRV